jgi:hypothetical protein
MIKVGVLLLKLVVVVAVIAVIVVIVAAPVMCGSGIILFLQALYYFNTGLMYIIFVRHNLKVFHCQVCNCGFTVLQTQCLGMFIIYLQTKFHIPLSRCPIVIPPKTNTV